LRRAVLILPFALKEIPLGDKGKDGMGMGILEHFGVLRLTNTDRKKK
jgi:hypothetical protein